jgi:hypothetical protein
MLLFIFFIWDRKPTFGKTTAIFLLYESEKVENHWAKVLELPEVVYITVQSFSFSFRMIINTDK